ncbi:MAG: hypothetical protein CVT77_16940 [Alphaproteobacteria bacterium HGW-Alphaproteobacteria-16]|nr:MAG: hypothetical protein CVT77_16940 [Alphaproteobacteria bacterium HGW-Alphaproteobacteria-16]
MTALSLILATLAFVLFGLSTVDHHRRRMGAMPDKGRVRTFRRAAWVALLLAFPPAIVAQGWVFGPILWCASIMAGAGAVFLALNFLPTTDRR